MLFHSLRLLMRQLLITSLALVAILGTTTLTQRAFGQDEGAAAKPPPASPKSAAPGNSPSAHSEWERLFYIPYRNLRDVFEKEGSTVFMPYGQFLKLWERLPKVDLTKAPTINAVITSVAYSGLIEKDVARIDVELTIQALGKPWVEVPIQFGEAAIGRMTASDDKTLLHGTGPGTYLLLLAKSGEHKIKLELVARVRNSPDGRSLELDGPTAGITTFELTVPTGDQTIDVSPNGVVTAASGDDKSTTVKTQLVATAKITARWRPRVSTAPAMEVLTSVQNTLDMHVADGLVHTHATLRYDVLRGQVDQLRIGVPLDQRILDVSSAGLKSWNVVREQKRQALTINLLGNDARSILVEVHTEREAPAGPFPVAGVDDTGVYHGIHSLDEVRENGTLAIGHSPDLSLTVEQQAGVVRLEAADAPEALRRPENLLFRYYTPKFRLLVSARPLEPRLLIEQRTQLVFRDDELQTTTQSDYTIERAGVFEIRMKVPAGLKIDRVDCEPMKEFQIPDEAGELVVSLREKTQGKLSVVVTGHIPIDPGENEARSLPLLEPLQATRVSGLITLFAPDSLEVIADDKGMQGAQPARLDAARIAPLPNVRPISSWTYTRQPTIAVRTQRKGTRMVAAVATAVTLRPELLEVVTRLDYQVRFAGIDTFRFAVPEAIADSVQIESADQAKTPIKQKSRAEKADEGWVTWTVVLQRPVTGLASFRVRYDSRPEVKEKQATASVEPLRILDTPGIGKGGIGEGGAAIVPAAVSGEIAIQKERSLSIAASGAEFEPIDVRELTLLPAEGYLAYRYFKQPEKLETPFALELSATRHEIQPVLETVVAQSLVEVVVTEDKSATYRCRYRLKTSARQRLAIDLPQDAEVLDTLVAGQRVDLEKGDDSGSKEWDGFRLNVSRSTPSDEPFVMTLIFRVPFKDIPLRGRGGNLKLPFPRIGGGTAEARAAVAQQQLRTVVWVPSEFSLVGTPKGFYPERPTDLSLARGAVAHVPSTSDVENWFGGSGPGAPGFAFTPSGKAYVYHRPGSADLLEASYWRTSWFTWTISGAIFFVALILSRTSWENRLTIVLLASFAAALYALRDADLVLNLVGAARFGLVALAAYWLIHALTRPRSATAGITFRPAEPATAVAALGAVIPPPGLFETKPRE